MENTNVVCRELGYTKGLAFMFMGQGTGNILLDDVKCGGFETSLDKCSHNGWGKHDCGHDEDVGIACHDGKGQLEIQFASYTWLLNRT